MTIESIGDPSDYQWALDYLDKKDKVKPSNIGDVATGFIPYRSKNKNGISVHQGSLFYDNKPISLQLYIEYGGVCGAVSKGASGFCRVKGIPAYPVGQPGHYAFIWKKSENNWVIGNNVCGGWNWIQGGLSIPWEGPAIMIQVLDHYLGLSDNRKSTTMFYWACLVKDLSLRDQLVEESIKCNRKNYPAWEAKLRKISKKQFGLNLKNIMKGLQTAFHEEPAFMEYIIQSHVIPKMKGIKNKEILHILSYLVDKKESATSQEIYLRNAWKLICENISELSEMKIHYDHKTSSNILQRMKEYCLSDKIKSQTKKKICFFLQEVISSLETCNNTRKRFVNLYIDLLGSWKNERLNDVAHEFVKSYPISYSNKEYLKDLLTIGLNIAKSQKDDFTIKQYSKK